MNGYTPELGNPFVLDGITLKVEETSMRVGCDGCAMSFDNETCKQIHCTPSSRPDGKAIKLVGVWYSTSQAD